MDIIKVIFTSIFSLGALFVMSRIMGNKQISQSTLFDYIIGISIGSIAAEMATELEKPLRPLIALIVYALTDLLLSVISQKSLKVRTAVSDEGILLMRAGKMYPEAFKKAKIDLSEFLMQLRNQGYFDISTIDTIFFETNGKLSIMPFSYSRPATPDDLQIIPKTDSLKRNVIMDGALIEENLKDLGFDENWLKKELKSRNIKRVNDVFLACADTEGSLAVYRHND